MAAIVVSVPLVGCSVPVMLNGMTPTPDNPITIFAETNFRNRRQTFGIKQADRRAHCYVIGKTGVGKSTLIKTMCLQDAIHGRGFALIDPHGDLAESIRDQIPAARQKDLLYFDAGSPSLDLSFNPLERVPPSKQSLAASALLGAFRTIWQDSWGPRLEHILRNCILALLETEGATLADILKLLLDDRYRVQVAAKLQNKAVKTFWLKEFASYPARLRGEAIAPIQNKVGAFVADPILNRILNQPKSSLPFRASMDGGKILLFNLSKGKLGYDSSRLLGALILSRLAMAALSRADQPEADRRDFACYLDEFPGYTTLELAMMLSELRKYRFALILAHQFITQLSVELRDAILGNVGTIISFRLGLADAELLAKEFYPEITMSDLVSLPNYNMYLKLMIDGVVSKPFSAQTIVTTPDGK